MIMVRPLEKIENIYYNKKIFLAGSIEQDTAERWQDKAAKLIEKYEDYETVVLNPRRDSWDSTTEQSIKNPDFKAQVDWELNYLHLSNHVLMYFDKNTKSPITLLELGLLAGRHDLRVVCPEGFWRKGNVDIVCARFNIPQFPTLEEAIVNIFQSDK